MLARPVSIVVLSPCSSLFQVMRAGPLPIEPLDHPVEQGPYQRVETPGMLQPPYHRRAQPTICTDEPATQGGGTQCIIPEAPQGQHPGRFVGSIHSGRDVAPLLRLLLGGRLRCLPGVGVRSPPDLLSAYENHGRGCLRFGEFFPDPIRCLVDQLCCVRCCLRVTKIPQLSIAQGRFPNIPRRDTPVPGEKIIHQRMV